MRGPQSSFYIFLNDKDVKCSQENVRALEEYNIQPIFRSEINEDKTIRFFKAA